MTVIPFPGGRRIPDRVIDLARHREVQVGATRMSRRVAIDLMAIVLREHWGESDPAIYAALHEAGFTPQQIADLGPEAVGRAREPDGAA